MASFLPQLLSVKASYRAWLERGNMAGISSLGYSLASFWRCHSQSPLHLSTSIVLEREKDKGYENLSEYLNKYTVLYSRAQGSLVE